MLKFYSICKQQISKLCKQNWFDAFLCSRNAAIKFNISINNSYPNHSDIQGAI